MRSPILRLLFQLLRVHPKILHLQTRMLMTLSTQTTKTKTRGDMAVRLIIQRLARLIGTALVSEGWLMVHVDRNSEQPLAALYIVKRSPKE